MNYPIGLLTAEEVNLAGGRTGYMNTLYYLYSGTSYWTMSSSSLFMDWYAFDSHINSTGDLYIGDVHAGYGVRLSFF